MLKKIFNNIIVSIISMAAVLFAFVGFDKARADTLGDSFNITIDVVPTHATIVTPATGKICSRTPTITGITNWPNREVIIMGTSGHAEIEVARVTSDANGKFQVAVESSKLLDTGSNTLSPYTESRLGDAVTVDVQSDPSYTEVPRIEIPEENYVSKGDKPIVSGKSKPNQTVIFTVKDQGNNLLLTDIANTTSNALGEFRIVETDYSQALPNGKNYLTVTVDGVTSDIRTISLVDPYGVVFDSVGNTPLVDASVTLYYDNDPGSGRSWVQAVPGVHIGTMNANPQITTDDGAYSYLAINGDYYISVSAAGYVYPSSVPIFPSDRSIVTGSKSEVFTIAGEVKHIDLPMDSNTEFLKIRKTVNKKEVVVGDIVTYTVTIENTTTNNAYTVVLEDKIPAGFKYMLGKTIFNNVAHADPTGTRPLIFSIGTVEAGKSYILKYQLVVGSGVSFGKYDNIAFARYAVLNSRISNSATATVKVVPDATFDLSTIIGKVFHDVNENGIQDMSEKPIPNVMIATEEGIVITTDQDGKFHVPLMNPGRHVFRIDEKTLPQGAYLTTDKAVIVDITPGLMVKVNFGVNFQEQQEIESGGGAFAVTQDKSKPVPKLNVAMFRDELIINDKQEAYPVEFRIFCNYSMFIQKWKIEILDKDTGAIVVSFSGDVKDINEVILWDGTDNSNNKLNSFKNYVYLLKVFGLDKREDSTKERKLVIRQEVEEDQSISNDELQEAKEKWITQESNANILLLQNINIQGEMIRINSVSREIYDVKILKSGELMADVAVAKAKGISPSELLEKPFIPEENKQQVVDIIVPLGEYDVVINQDLAQITEEDIIYAKKQELGQEAIAPIEKPSVFVKHIKVGEDYIFLVGMGDAKLGYNFNKGNMEPVAQDDKFNQGLWYEGKMAYYLKGKIKGRYLITSSFDTNREKKELFKNIDKDKDYPIYGDSSSINYSATDTQGPLYLLIEWDKSKMQWGNFNTSFSDTEFAQFNRSLYGAKMHYEDVSVSQFGQPKNKLIVFKATAQQKAAHNELVGTGGSLYYLKHQDILEGSDKVYIETRDKITGLVVGIRTMERNTDYNIDCAEGRIVFWKPITQFSADTSIISGQLLDGNSNYVVVDYEYETQDKYFQGTYGVRTQRTLTDYVSVGGTYVNEEQLNNNYELKGTDAIIHLGKNIKITGEYAESSSESLTNYLSTDGGLSFSQIDVGDQATGKAYGVNSEVKLFNNLAVTGYYKMIDKNFSASSIVAQQGKEMLGFGFTWDASSKTRFSLTHDIQKLLEGGNLQTQIQIGAQETKTTIAQVSHEVTDKFRLIGEYRKQEVVGKTTNIESETNNAQDTVALKAEYKPVEKITLSLEEQANLGGQGASQTIVGVEANVTENTSLRAQESVGESGMATTVGITSGVKDKFQVFSDYTIADSATSGKSDTTSVGGNIKVDDKTELRTSYAVTDSAGVDSSQAVSFGSKRKLNDNVSFTNDKIYTTTNNKVTQTEEYGLEKDGAGRKLKASVGVSHGESTTETSDSNIFGLSGDINNRWAGLFNFERGNVTNLNGTKTDRYAGSFGLSYVNQDKLKFSNKLELRLDDGLEDSRQYVLYSALEGKLTQNLSAFTKANVSNTLNTTSDTTSAQYKELTAGVAYRPVDFDNLNLIGKYTYLEDNSPTSQSTITDILREKSHVISAEGIYDFNEHWQTVDKLAYKIKEEQVSGFDFTRTSAWLAISRLNYKINDDWKVGAEYRKLIQEQAQDSKDGALAEVSRKIGDFVEVGVGYNFTDFNDDLTHLNYTSQGPFIRFTGKLFERTPEEIERAKTVRLEKLIKVWVNQLVNDELSNPESEITQELSNYLFMADKAKEDYRFDEAKELYEKVLRALKMMKDECNEYIRIRIEMERSWKDNNLTALTYFRQGNKVEAKGIWEEILFQIYRVDPIYVDFEKEDENES